MKAVEILPEKTLNEPPYLIMEWIPPDFRSFSFKDNEKQAVLEQVSNGLSFMHDNAFAHRDLKPENILIDEYEGGLVAKIADVGMSKLDRVGNLQTYAGSIVYMAPELWAEEHRACTRGDGT